MPEIRDRVKHEMTNTVQKLMQATEAYERGDISWEETALYTQAYPEEILSIPEIAVVDRDTKPPECDYCYPSEEMAERCPLLKEGYIKEVKE